MLSGKWRPFSLGLNELKHIESGAVITLTNITWHCIEHYINWGKTLIRICTKIKYLISRHSGQAMGHLFWWFCKKLALFQRHHTAFGNKKCPHRRALLRRAAASEIEIGSVLSGNNRAPNNNKSWANSIGSLTIVGKNLRREIIKCEFNINNKDTNNNNNGNGKFWSFFFAEFVYS